MLCTTTLFFELLITLILKRVLGVEPTDFYAGVFILIFGFSYFLTLYSSRRFTPVRRILLVGFFLRVFLLFWDIYARNVFALPSSGLDSENFFYYALRYAAGMPYWQNSAVVFFGTMAKAFGNSRVLLQFCLMLFSVASAHIVYRIMNLLDLSVKSTQKALWFMALLPMYAVLSSIFLRESLITLTVSISLFFFIQWWLGKREAYFWTAIVVSFMGVILHSGMISVTVGYVGIHFLYDRKKQAFRLNAWSLIVAILFALLLGFLYSRYPNLFFKKMSNIEDLSDIASGSGSGGSSYAAIAGNSSNIFNFIIFSPVRMFLFLFAPLFFQIRGVSDLIAMVFSAFFYIWVYYRVFRALRHTNRDSRYRNLLISLLIIVLVVAFVFGWGGTNIGTQIRHRDKTMPIYILMLALSFEPWYRR